MVVPFFGRLRRRRLLFIIVFAIFFTLFMNHTQDQSDLLASEYIPASAPAGSLDSAKHKIAAAAAGAAHSGDDLIAGSKSSAGRPVQNNPSAAAGDAEAATPAVPAAGKFNLVAGDVEDDEAEITGKKADVPAALQTDRNKKALQEIKDKQAKEGTEAPPKPKKLTLAKLLETPMDPMEYGTNARPPIKGLTKVVADLPVELIVDDEDAATAGSAVGAVAGKPLRRRRFVFVGDVHGQRKPLDELLDKIGFEVGQDHLILVGDLINKGPDSAGVVQLAMELGASAVRGNHEDRVLVAYEALQATKQLRTALPPKAKAAAAAVGEVGVVAETAAEAERKRLAEMANIEAEGKMERASAMLQREVDLQEEDARKHKGFLTFLGLKKEEKEEEDIIDHDKMVAELDIDPLEQNPFSHDDSAERATTSSLSAEQVRWLSELPVILRLGAIAPSPAVPLSAAARQANAKSPFTNDVVVVHAGLVPELPLEQQDPYAVMVMRSLVHPADEVRHERARLIAEARMRTEARGRIKNTDRVNVPKGRVDNEYHRLQKLAYGSDPHHPRRPNPNGSPRNRASSSSSSREGHPEPADLVMLPIEGHFREGTERVHWATVWNQVQHAKADPTNRTTVVYGHDAITGLLVPETVPSGLSSLFSSGGNGVNSGSVITEEDTGYTFGLDSGAVYGGKLTALVVEAGKDGVVKHRIEQVSCPAIAPKKHAD